MKDSTSLPFNTLRRWLQSATFERHRQRSSFFPPEILETRIAPASANWIGGVSNNWADAGNWDTGQVPGAQAGDATSLDVTINVPGVTVNLPSGSFAIHSLTVVGNDHLGISGGSLTLSAASSITNLDLTSGTITANAKLSLTGFSTLDGGGSNFSGVIENDGALSIISSNPHIIGGTFTNAGAVTEGNARLDLNNTGTSVVNTATGTWDVHQSGDGAWLGNFGGSFTNSGLIKRTGSGTASLSGTPFSNSAAGQFQLTAGNLQFDGSGIWQDGAFSVATGSVAYFDGTSATFSGTLTGSGAGRVRLGSGTMNIDTAGLTLNFPTGLFEFGGGSANFAGGTVTNASTGYVHITDSNPHINNATFLNAGHVLQSNARLDLNGTGNVTNQLGGVWDVDQSVDGSWLGNFGSSFTNSGLIQRTNTGLADIGGTPFNNTATGTFDLTVGALDFNAGGTWQGGNFTVASGSVAYFNGTSATFSGSLTGSGAGTVRLGSGTMNIDTAGLTLNFPAGLFEFGGGSANFTGGTVTNASTGYVHITDSNPHINNATFLNAGHVLQSNARLDLNGTGHVANQFGAFWDVDQSGDGAWLGNFGDSFTNSGLIQRTNTGLADLGGTPFNNTATGTFDLTAGALEFNAGGTWQGGNFKVASGSVAYFNGTSAIFSGTLTGNGAGTVRLGSGTMNIDTAGLTLNFPSGLFEFGGSATFAGGKVTNIGFVHITDSNPHLSGTAFHNAGTVLESNARLDLNVDGNNIAGAVINEANGIWDVDQNGDGAWLGNFGGSFTNLGLVKRTNIGTADIGGTPFNNTGGSFNVTTGNLQINGSGAWTGVATISAASGTTAYLDGTSATFSGTLTGGGDGLVRFGTGTINLAPAGLTLNFPAGYFQFGGGGATIAGGTVTNLGAITITDNNPHISGAVFDNKGTVDQQNARLDLNGASSVINEASGVWTLSQTSDGAWLGSFGGGFTNAGLIKRAGSGVASLSGTPFDNHATGAFQLLTGSLQLNGPGTWTGGFFAVNAGSIAYFDGTSATFSGTLSGSGAGTVRLGSGTMNLAGAGLTLNFPAGLFEFGGGGANFAGGTVTNASTGYVHITDSNPHINSATFLNAGHVLQSNARLDLNGTGSVTNQFGAVWDVDQAGDGSWLGNFGSSFTNSGLIQRTNTGSADIGGTPFNNTATGTFALTKGALYFNAGGTWQGGGFTVASGATAYFDGTSATFSGTLTGSGAGTVRFGNGTMTAGSSGLTLNFPAGLFEFGGSGAAFAGGTVTNAATGYVHITDSNPHIASGTFVNAGHVRQSNARLDLNVTNGVSGNVVNQATGTWDVEGNGDGAWLGNFGGVFANAGLVRRNGSGEAQLGGTPFSNPGTVEVVSGSLRFDGPLAELSSGALTGGVWKVDAGATLLLPANVTDNQATVVINGSAPQFQNTLVSNSGSFTTGPGVSLSTPGNLANSGLLSIGGTLTVNGNFSQTAGATLTANVGQAAGNSGGAGIVITGSAALAGTLDIAVLGGFGPVTGQVFGVMTYASHTGDFSAVNGLAIGGVTFFQENTTAAAVTVTALHDAADLAPQSVTIPSSALVGLPVTIGFTVKNTQDVPTFTAAWTDSIYLSTDNIFDSSDVLIGTVAHNGILAGGASYSASLTATLPAVLPGNYHILVVADSNNSVPDSNRLDTILSSKSTVSADLQALTRNVTQTGSISSGQSLYYRLDEPSGNDALLTGSLQVAGEAAFYARIGAIPDSTHYDYSATSLSALEEKLALLNAPTSPYFILVQGLSAAGSGASFSLSTRDLGFEIVGTSPVAAGNGGPTTITITGSHFTAATLAQLIAPDGSALQPTNLQVQNGDIIVATFDLTNKTPGQYDIKVTDSGAVILDQHALLVGPATLTHSGTISSNQEWLSGFVHEITGSLTVNPGVTLTIDPGAIVKLSGYADFTINGSLVADGTLTQPIIFTSLLDDTHGGDTNGDGAATAPSAGDWGRIVVSGSADFNHAQVLYGGGTASGFWEQTGAIRTTGNATLNFANSVIQDAFFDGILAWGGTATISNSVFVRIDRAVCAHPGSPVTVTNSTFYDDRVALLIHGGTLTVANSIVDNSLDFGFEYDFGTFAGASHTDVYSTVPGSVNYNFTSLTGTNGNISADPKFKNPTAGDFRLNYLSPAIDSAAGAVAGVPAIPVTDFYGLTRYDDPRTANTGTALPSGGSFPDMGAFEFVESEPSSIDLVVTNVHGDPVITAGQTAHVTWTVANNGSSAFTGSWHDELLLVSLDGQTILDAGSVLSAATLGAGQSTTFSANVNVPFGTEGQYHWEIHTNSAGEIFEGLKSGNNVGLAAAASQLNDPILTVGVQATGTFSTVNGGLLYKIHPTPGSDIVINAGRNDSGLTELFLGVGQAPTITTFFEHSAAGAGAPASLEISHSLDTDYYVLVVPRSLPTGPATFTLGASPALFNLGGLEITQGGNTGTVTVPFDGAQFAPGLTFTLNSTHGTVKAQSVQLDSSTHGYATFNLTGLATGAYDVSVTENGQTKTLPGGFSVVAGANGPQVEAHLVLPDHVRANRVFTAYIEYTNAGTDDAYAPLLQVTSSTGNQMRLDSSHALSSSISLVGVSPDGPAGILRPGETLRVPIQVLSTEGDNTLQVGVAQPTKDLFDFAALKTNLTPDEPEPDYSSVFDSLVHGRSTSADYEQLVSQASTLYAKRTGAPTFDIGQALAFYISDAIIDLHTKISGFVFVGDSLHPANNVLVTATNKAGDVFTALSFADGSVRFIDLAGTALPAGTLPSGYSQKALPAGTYTIGFEDYLAPTNLAPVVVSATGATAGNSWVLQPGGEFTGHIVVPTGVDLTGQPEPAIVAKNAAGQVFQTSIADNGTYALQGLPDGVYTVSVASHGLFVSPAPIPNLQIKNGQVVQLAELTGTPGGTVTGTITDASTHQVLAGVTVTLYDDAQPYTTLTDASGHYELDHIRSGPHQITAILGNYGKSTLTAVPVAESQTTPNENFALSAIGSVSGIVTDAGAPLKNLAVEIEDASGNIIGATLTDSAGHYSLHNLVAGSYTLVIDTPQAALEHDAITLGAAENQTHNVALTTVAAIQGAVRQAGTGRGITGAVVDLLDSENNLYSTITDQDGSWSFGRLPAGDYTIMLGDGSNRSTVHIAAGSTAVQTVNIDLSYGAIIGQILLPDGSTPNPSATVALMKDGQFLLQTPVASNGYYVFTTLVAGAYDIVVSDPAYSYAPALGVSVATGKDTILPGETPGSATLHLVTTDGSGHPIGLNGSVTLQPLLVPDALKFAFPLSVPPSGILDVSHLAPGEYLLETSFPGHANVKQIVTIADGANSVNLSDGGIATLSGQITSDGAHGVAGLDITVYDPNQPRVAWKTTTDASGNYSLPYLPAGHYSVVVSDNRADFAGSPYAVMAFGGLNLTSGNASVQNATLSLGNITLAGHVADGVSHLPSSGSALAYNADGVLVATTPLDVNGNFTFKTLAPGSYTVTASAEGFDVHGKTTTVHANQSVAGLLIAATWSIDPPGLHTNGILSSISTSISNLVGQTANAVADALGQPHPAPQIGHPLFDILPADCPCPKAQGWWARAKQLDGFALDTFSSLEMLWEADVQINGANLGTFLAKLDILLGQLYVSAGKLTGTGANSTANALSGELSSLESLNAQGALTAGQYAVYSERIGTAYNAAAKFLGLVPKAADQVSNAAQAAGGVEGNLIQGQAPGTFDSFVGAIQNVISSHDVPSLLALGDATNTLVSQANGVIQAFQALNGIATGALSSAIGNITNALGPILDAARGINEYLNSVQDYLVRVDQYNKIISQRDVAVRNTNDAIIECLLSCHHKDPPPNPVPDPPPIVYHRPPPTTTPSITSHDPNDKITTGFGASHFIAPTTTIPYTIDFENQSNASAAAQRVVVTDQLSSLLDWSSVQLGDIGFNGVTIAVPAGLTHYETTVTVSTDPNPVHVVGDFNRTTGLLTWTIESVDPVTGQLPDDPFAGFLPPNNSGNQGEGFVSLTVHPLTSVNSGDVIHNQAHVVFDENAPIDTPDAVNTIDKTGPASSVNTLSAVTSGNTVQLNWAGTDNNGGSGIASYNIFVSDNNGAFTPYLLDTALTSATFTGHLGHTYRFVSQAVDNVGNAEPLHNLADASTTLATFTTLQGATTFTDADGDTYTVTLKGPGTAQLAQDSPAGDGKGAIALLQLNGTTAASALSITVKKGPGGDGKVNLEGLVDTGALGSFAAGNVILSDAGAIFTGNVGAVQLGNVIGGASIQIGGATTDKTSISLGTVGDGTNLTVAGQITSLTAASIGRDHVTASAIGALKVSAGGFAADLDVTGAIGAITVVGGVFGDWTAANFGKISVTGGNFTAAIAATASSATLGKTLSLSALSVGGGDIDGSIDAHGSIGPVSAVADKQHHGGIIEALAVTGAPQNVTSITALAVDSLTLQAGSLGAVKTTAGGFNASLELSGALGSLSISGGALEGNLSAATIGSVKVTGGDLLANLSATGQAGAKPLLVSVTITGGNLDGALHSSGGIGAIKVSQDSKHHGGDVVGASIDFGGSSLAAGLSAHSVVNATISGGDLHALATTGGSLAANLDLAGAVGAITTAGGGASGAWTAASFGTVKINGGDFVANLDAIASSTVLGKKAAFGAVTVQGGDLNAHFAGAGAVSSITVKSDKAHQGGHILGAAVDLGAGQLGAVSALDIVGSSFSAGSASGFKTSAGGLGADLTITNAIGAINIAGGAASGAWTAANFAAIQITGGDFSVALTSTAPSAGAKPKPAVAGLTVKGGDFTGAITALGSVSSVAISADKTNHGGNIVDATITAHGIGSVAATGDVRESLILSGADLGQQALLGGAGVAADTFAAGAIGSVKIGGNVTGSVIAAGLSTTDVLLKNGHDSVVGGAASSIGSLQIGGAADASSYFVAGQFTTSPVIGGAKVTDPTQDGRFLV